MLNRIVTLARNKRMDLLSLIFISMFVIANAKAIPLTDGQMNQIDSNAMKMKDTTRLKPARFNGNFAVESVWSDQKFPFQTQPSSYTRFVFNSGIQIGLIPLRSSALLTTEQFSVSHPIINYSLQFDYNAFSNKLQESINAKRRINDSILSADTNLLNYSKLTQRKTIIEQKLKNPRYTKQLEKDQRITSAYTDTALAIKDLNWLNAKKRLREHKELETELKKIDEQLPTLEAYKRDKKVQAHVANLQNQDLGADLKRYGLSSASVNRLLALKRFDLGNTSPDYSEFTINGLSLNGIGIEYNPGKLYTAFTYGRTVNRALTSFGPAYTDGRRITAIRIGYGKKDGNLICATLLSGKDGQGQYMPDSARFFQDPLINTVISIQGKWKFKELFVLESEYAGSINTFNFQNVERTGKRQTNQSPFEKLNDAFSKNGHQAAYIKATGSVTSANTEWMLAYRTTESRFYSFGNPVLRPDNKRAEGKVKQQLFKKQVALSGAFQRNEDNILTQKQYTTVTNLGNFLLDFHFRNIPFVLLSYTPSVQHYKGQKDNNRNNVSNTDIYMATSGYTYRYRKTTYGLTLLYSYQRSSSKLFNYAGWVRMYAFNPQVILPNGLQFYGNATITKAGGTMDSTEVQQFSLSAMHTFLQKIRVSITALHSNDFTIQKRNGLQTALSIPFTKKTRGEAGFDYYKILNYAQNKSDHTQLLFRIKFTCNL